MIRYSIIYSIYLLFSFTNAEPLKGHKILSANPHDFPFIASLGRKPSEILLVRSHFCTGVLVTKKHVLTAAHCIENENKNEIDVIIGEIDLRTARVKYDVDSWITYVDWTLKRGIVIEFEINDVAIVKLSSTIKDKGVIPVSFTNLNAQQLHRTNAMIAGWGMTNEGKLADTLQKAKVTIMTPKKCEDNIKLILNLPIAVAKNYLCTSAQPYALTDCGDSGGPLLDLNNNLLGITRSTCPTTHWSDLTPEFLNQYKVNIHMDINYYIGFIEDVTKIKIKTI